MINYLKPMFEIWSCSEPTWSGSPSPQGPGSAAADLQLQRASGVGGGGGEVEDLFEQRLLIHS